MLLIWSKY